jgi:hypothetical protein
MQIKEFSIHHTYDHDILTYATFAEQFIETLDRFRVIQFATVLFTGWYVSTAEPAQIPGGNSPRACTDAQMTSTMSAVAYCAISCRHTLAMFGSL